MANITVDVLMNFGAGLVSVISDVLGAGDLKASWGNTACDPQTRVADTGQFTFTLNNSQANSNKTIGYYSPGNGSVRSGFTIKTPVVLKRTYGGVTKFKRFYVASIDPLPGVRGDRSVAITAYDKIDDLANQPATTLSVGVSQRVDQGLTTLMALLPVAPLHTNLQTGLDTLPYIFDDITATDMILTAVQHLVMSDAGYFAMVQDATDGETAQYQTRQYRQSQSSGMTISADLNDTHVPTDKKTIANDVLVSAYPFAIGTSPETLYQSANEITVQPGSSAAQQFNFTDPMAGTGSANKVRIYPGSGIAPVAGTDFKASFNQGGESAQDANASLSFTISWYNSYASVVFINSSGNTLFIQPFVLRGTIMRGYNQVDVRVLDTAPNLAAYGDMTLNYSMYYQPDPNVASDMANHWFSMWHLPVPVSEYHEYYANRNAVTAAASIALDVGNRYTAVESVTGINNDYNIMGIDITISAGAGGNPIVLMRYYPEPTNLIPGFILDDVVFGVLDTGPGVLSF